MPVSPGSQPSVDVVLVGVHQGALGDGRLDHGPDRHLLHVGQHLDDRLAAPLEQAQDRRLVLVERAASRRTSQPPPAGRAPLWATTAGFPLCPATM